MQKAFTNKGNNYCFNYTTAVFISITELFLCVTVA